MLEPWGISHFYINSVLKVPSFWNLSRKHVRLETSDNKFAKLNKFENRINAKELIDYFLLDTKIRQNPGHDAGIAAMSISMVPYDHGLGSCILGSIYRAELRRILNVPEGLEIVLAVALGYPAEDPIAEKVRNGDIKYWLDNNNVLHVPKRELKDVVKWNRWQKESEK